MKSYKIISFLMLLSITFTHALDADPIPLEKLLCGGNSSAGSLSPSGRYYAAMVPSSPPECEISEEDEKKDPIVDVLVVIDLEDGMKAKRLSGTNLNARVGGFQWLNDETLSISRSSDRQMGDKFNPDLYTLFTLNIKTGKRETLYKATMGKSGGGQIPRLVSCPSSV